MTCFVFPLCCLFFSSSFFHSVILVLSFFIFSLHLRFFVCGSLFRCFFVCLWFLCHLCFFASLFLYLFVSLFHCFLISGFLSLFLSFFVYSLCLLLSFLCFVDSYSLSHSFVTAVFLSLAVSHAISLSLSFSLSLTMLHVSIGAVGCVHVPPQQHNKPQDTQKVLRKFDPGK